MQQNDWTRRVTRRGLLRSVSGAAGVLGLAPLIAACGSNSAKTSHAPAGAAAPVSGATVAATTTAIARAASEPGVTADTITLGTTYGLTGPGSAYAPIIQTVQAYLQRVNDGGGVNGRKVKLLIEDDAYSAANTPPLTKKLVEQDGVLAIVSPLGTAPQAAVQDYLNEQRVPQLFINSGASRWNNPTKYPWTVGFPPAYPDEARVFGKYISQTWPGKKVGVLYQNDDFGKDYLVYKETLSKDNPIVDEESYETTAADLNAQITNLKAKGAEVFFLVATTKPGGLALKAAAEQGWKPLIAMTSNSADPAIFNLAGGQQNAEGIVSSAWYKQYDSGDQGIQPVKDLLAKYAPQIQLSNWPVYGYAVATLLEETLRRAGTNPTRASLLTAAESIDHFPLPGLVSGLTASIAKSNHAPLRGLQLTRVTGGKFVPFGDVISVT
ncbi:MAG: ABC transporter substrate-binding protein [Dehalococcoidia bacterium]